MKTISRILRSTDVHWVGDGFRVHSVFDYNNAGRELSPFLLMDYAAPHEFTPTSNRRGVEAHPHKGFETVTVVYQGELEHRDSGGGGGVIGPGDVQWMTAGRGIIHEEFHSPAFSSEGGTMEMVQLWVNLRASDKSAAPRYQTLTSDQIPTISLPTESGTVRIIAGQFGEQAGPAKTFSTVNLWDVQCPSGGTQTLPVPDGHTAAVLVLRGSITIAQDQKANPGDLAVFSQQGESVEWQAAPGSRVLFLGGDPIDEPIVGRGPFVMNTIEEIQQAYADHRAGKFGK